MKLILTSALFFALTGKSADAAGGNLYTYYESGGLGPSNWANLEIDGNQCGGTNGASGFGQSPVTIDSETVSTCDTDLAAYEFNGGDCTWDDLKFSINNGGESCIILRRGLPNYLLSRGKTTEEANLVLMTLFLTEINFRISYFPFVRR